MTKVMIIKLNSVNDVKEFVGTISRLPYGARVHSEGYIVSAGSLMGMFSLDLSKAIKVEFDEELSWDDIEPFKKWEVNNE